MFCHYIAESRREELADLASAKFFSVLMDGSTDKGNIAISGALMRCRWH